jgi:hypothetical protein
MNKHIFCALLVIGSFVSAADRRSPVGVIESIKTFESWCKKRKAIPRKVSEMMANKSISCEDVRSSNFAQKVIFTTTGESVSFKMPNDSKARVKFMSNPLNKILIYANYGDKFEIIPGVRLRVISDSLKRTNLEDYTLSVRVLINKSQ